MTFSPHFGKLVRALIIFGALTQGCISHYHLGLEKEWNGELQQMIDHDMQIVSSQNKYIEDLELELRRAIRIINNLEAN